MHTSHSEMAEGDRAPHIAKLGLLSDAFGQFLKFGLKPDHAVNASILGHALVPCDSCHSSVSQEFKSYFPNLPEPVSDALFDLYRQVLLHVEINSKARTATFPDPICMGTTPAQHNSLYAAVCMLHSRRQSSLT